MKEVNIEEKKSTFFNFFSVKKQPRVVLYKKISKNLQDNTCVLECLIFTKAPILGSL